MSHTVHLGKGRSITFRDDARLLTDHVVVKLDRITHAKLKLAAAHRKRPMAELLREKIYAEIAEHEEATSLAAARREPWRPT